MTGHHSTIPTVETRRPGTRIGRPTLVAAVATAATLVPLVYLATLSDIAAIVAVVTSLLILAVVTLGLERTAETLVVLGVFLVPMNDLHTSGAASFVTAADATFFVGFALMLPHLLGRQLQLPAAFVFGAGGVFSVALISSLLSENPLLSLNATARLLVGAIGLVVLIAWWNPGLKKVVILAWAYVLGNAVSVVYGRVDDPVLSDGRLFGLTEHPNILGVCSLLAVALIPFLLTHTAQPRRWLPALLGAISLYGIWISGSRGALASMLAVALVYPLLRRSVPAALALFAVLIAGLAFSDHLLDETSSSNALGRLLGGGSSTGSDQAREGLATEAVDQFLSHPILGVGLDDALAAHVIYLQIAAGVGAVGLAFYLIVLWTTVRPAVVLTPPFNLLAIPALAYTALGLVTPLLWDRYIWAVLALSLLAPRLAARGPTDDQATDDTKLATGGSVHARRRSTP